MPASATHRLVLAMVLGCIGAPAHATTFVAQYVPPAASLQPNQPMPPPSAGLTPGLHVFVSDGSIVLSNAGGSQSFSAGQFGFVRSTLTPPVIVPANPGLQFSPPPVFSAQSSPSASSGQPSEMVNCIVR